jgi:ribose transport system substrate-binding protein
VAPTEIRGVPRASVALFLRTLANDYQDRLREDCLAAAGRRGYAVSVFSADNDPDRQAHQIRACLTDQSKERPGVILVSPVRETTLLMAAYEAARAGVGWVVLNRSSEYLPELRRAFPEVPLFCVNCDQIEVGRIQGQQFKILLPTGGELLYVQGPILTSSAQRRLLGLQQILKGTRIKMSNFSADWSLEGGELAARCWAQGFRHRELPPCVIGAQNDSMAMGARKAFMDEAEARQRPDLARIRITGCDGTPGYGQRLVGQRQLTATVVIPSVAGRAVDELTAFLERRHVPAAEVVLEVSPYPDWKTLETMARTGP